MKKLNSIWIKATIKNKISLFIGTVLLTIVVAIVFDAFLIRLFVIDINEIMEDNSNGGQIIISLDEEKASFNKYIDNKSEDNLNELMKALDNTSKAIDKVPLDYNYLGEDRYAQLFSLKTTYGVYRQYMDELLNGDLLKDEYVSKLYSIYNMQDYMVSYSRRFVDFTLKEGNAKYKELIPKVLAIPVLALAISAFFFVVVVEISRRMNKDITEPVLTLADASRRIAINDFYIDDVVVKNEDEIGELVHAFNKMKYATGEYIDALEKRREALDRLHAKEVETLEVEKQLDAMNLELLKNQINPHFLFNTLNVIGGMANLEGADTTEEMIKALSSLFRYNLKTQGKEVLLSKELQVSENYMYLQKMRFGDRVKYIVKCTVDADDVFVPTFTLQPLIENCIIHGIAPKMEGGCVLVEISKREENLFISVVDTGVGMSQETLDKLVRSLEQKDSASMGIGMGNIYRRIKAMYKTASMVVESKEGVGTSVEIELPYINSDTYYKENSNVQGIDSR